VGTEGRTKRKGRGERDGEEGNERKRRDGEGEILTAMKISHYMPRYTNM